jgi:hypothetical protein
MSLIPPPHLNVARKPSNRHQMSGDSRNRPAKMAYEINRLRAALVVANREERAARARVGELLVDIERRGDIIRDLSDINSR